MLIRKLNNKTGAKITRYGPSIATLRVARAPPPVRLPVTAAAATSETPAVRKSLARRRPDRKFSVHAAFTRSHRRLPSTKKKKKNAVARSACPAPVKTRLLYTARAANEPRCLPVSTREKKKKKKPRGLTDYKTYRRGGRTGKVIHTHTHVL